MTSPSAKGCTRFEGSSPATFSKFCWYWTSSISKTWRRGRRGRHTSCKNDCNNSIGNSCRSKSRSSRNSKHLSKIALPVPPCRMSPGGFQRQRTAKRAKRSSMKERSPSSRFPRPRASGRTSTRASSTMRQLMRKLARRKSSASRSRRGPSNTSRRSKATTSTSTWARKTHKTHSTTDWWMGLLVSALKRPL